MGKWTFTQQGGEGKKLELADWNAPKGRPGQAPIFKGKLTVRHSETYYPGNDEPSRFIYGAKHEPIELEGKFRDAFGGKGYAQQMSEFARSFVHEKLPCKIEWTDKGTVHASFLGIIEWFESAPESAGTWGWKLSVAVDKDLAVKVKTGKQPSPVPFASRMDQVNNAIKYLMGSKRTGESFSTFPPSLDFGLSGFLDSLASYVNGPIALLNSLTSQLADMSKATMGSIKRAQAGTHQLKTGLLNLKQAFEDVRLDAAVISTRASEDVAFLKSQTEFSQGAIAAIKVVEQLRRDLARAEQGLIRGVCVAINGDTWEAIAARKLNDAGRASDIQRLNNEPGQPVPGTRYLIPR